MASYASYKKVDGNSIAAASLTAEKFNPNARKTFGVKWFYGSPNACSSGCCCLWTVPSGVTAINLEIWGSGGSGAGACSTSRCQHFRGSGGGAYNSKVIPVSPGWQYSVCAAGNGNCCRRECTGCQGCASYITGCGLSNFCAVGGSPACANGDWTTACQSVWDCCLQAGYSNGDFGYMNHSGAFGAAERNYFSGFCHCHLTHTRSSSAPLIGTEVQMAINYCWMRCGCWTVPYGHGGQSAMSSYCGGSGCCGTGNMGGPGLVRITFY